MKTTDRKPSSEHLAEANAEAMGHYKQMRARLMPAANVDEATCEIVLAMQLAVLGHEVPFKIHALRALALGAPIDRLRGLLLVGLGVTLVACETARALSWLDEACAERAGLPASASSA